MSLALETFGITAEVHEGYGMALVSVWHDLVVWTNGFAYHWWNGDYWRRTGHRKATYHPVETPEVAARRVAHRYAYLRESTPEGERPRLAHPL